MPNDNDEGISRKGERRLAGMGSDSGGEIVVTY